MTLRDLLIKLEAIPVEGMLISYRVESKRLEATT